MAILNRFPLGGADSSDLTATKSQVLSPYTAVTADSDGEPVEGTMVDNGAVNYSLSINGNYNIPQGYHNGQGKVTQNIATMNGSTVNPSTSTTTIATDKKYVNGNFIIPGFSLPNANVIKKGVTVTIYGRSVTGTFEGWVPSPTDWYYNGVYQYGWYLVNTNSWRNENTRIYCYHNGSCFIRSNNYFDLRSYNNLTIQGFLTKNREDIIINLHSGSSTLATVCSINGNTFFTLTMDISQLTTYTGLELQISPGYFGNYITQIRVS